MTSTFTAPIRRVETARGHYYRDANGTRVPGVTTIIGDGVPKPALINWAGNETAAYAVDNWDDLTDLKPAARLTKLQKARYEVKDAAAKRGTEVHGLAEKLVKGEEIEVPPELAGHVESYVRFLDEWEVEPVHVEFSVASYEHGYAGTGDLICWVTLPGGKRRLVLADVKTNRSGIYGETALQLAAYRYADKLLTSTGEQLDMPPVEGCAAIHVRADGYGLIPVTADQQQFRDFLYAKEVARFQKTSRDLVGDPMQPAQQSTYRLARTEA